MKDVADPTLLDQLAALFGPGQPADPQEAINLLSPTEYFILDLLIVRGPSYGLELVKRSDGKLKRGTVYVTLDRMEQSGTISSTVEDSERGPRRKYIVTGLGMRVAQAQRIAGAAMKWAWA